MQHIPVVSHALWIGTFILKMLDAVPTLQTPGSYHRQDWCFIYRGEEPHRTTRWRGRGERQRELKVSHRFQRRRDISKGVVSGISSPTGTTVLGSVDLYLGQCIRESVGVGGSTVVPLYIQWLEPRLFPTPWLIQWCHLSLFTSHHCNSTPPDPACKLPFFHAVVSGQGPDRQMDVKAKTSYLIQTVPLCYRIIISQRKKKKKKHCVTTRSFFSTSG